MKHYKYLIVFLLLSHSLFGQDTHALWQKFREGSSSERVEAAEALNYYYQSESKDSLRVIGEALFFYGIDGHYYPAIEKGKMILAQYYVLSGRTAEGISILKALLSNMLERGDSKQLCIASKAISEGYYKEKDAKSAYYWAQRAVQYSSKSTDPKDKASGLLALAEAYLLRNESRQAIVNYEKYIRYVKASKNARGLSAAYARLGDVYRLNGDLDKAATYFQLSFQEAKKAKLTAPLGHALNNLAIIYFERGDTIHSRIYFEKALKMREKSNDFKSIAESYSNLGDYHFYIDQFDKAQIWYQRSFDFAKKNQLKNEQKDALLALSELAKTQNDFKQATYYLEQHIELSKQIRIQELADDEELFQLQLRLNDLEQQSQFGKPSVTSNYFKWEWIIIGILALTLILVLHYWRSNSISLEK